MRIFSRVLDTSKAAVNLSENGILQGNKNIQLVLTLQENEQPITISDGAKPKLMYRYQNGSSPVTIDQTTADYPATVANNIITIAPNQYMARGYGPCYLQIFVNEAYTYTMHYLVDENKNFVPPPVAHGDSTIYALSDLSNVSDRIIKSKASFDTLASKDLSNVSQSSVQSKIDFTGYAKSDLTNVPDANIEAKCKASNFAQNNLADVDVQKLGEKVELTAQFKALQKTSTDATAALSTKADIDLQNVDFTKAKRIDNAINAIATRHDIQTAQVRAQLKEYEEQQAADFNLISEKFLFLRYQMTSNDQELVQMLPPLSDDRTIIIEKLDSTGISNTTLKIIPDGTDTINGTNLPLMISENGIAGVLFNTMDTWAWIPYPILHENGLVLSDDKSNVFVGDKNIKFEGATLSRNGDEITVKPDASSGTGQITFTDEHGAMFTSDKINSLDKSIHIVNQNGTASMIVNPNILAEKHNEGILAMLGNDELLNSKNGRAKLYFGDTRIKGGAFVYADLNTKSFVLQDIDPQDDPNISGGSTFMIGLYYEPSNTLDNTLTQDGSIVIELVDNNDNPITDISGNPMGAKLDYKAGDKLKPELYLGECQIKAFTEVHMKITPDFPTEEIISVGANTCILVQSISKNESGGLALLAFMAFTGYRIEYYTKYYGYNSLNFAQYLVFDQLLTTLGDNTTISFGDNVLANFAAAANVSINNYHFNVSDNGAELPIWSICKVYGEMDSHYIAGKAYKVTVTLTNKDNAFKVSMLEYIGTKRGEEIPIPKVETYNNENPIFTNDWVLRDTMFIAEDAINEDTTHTNNFTIPADPKGVAFLLYPAESQIPTNVAIKDFEGDITPWFNKFVITDNSHIDERIFENREFVYTGTTVTPTGYTNYRYTVNDVATNIPAGIVSGGDSKVINDNAWHDPGSVDPYKVQGDYKFLSDGKVTMSYQAQIYNEQGNINNVAFWLMKVSDSSEVTNSRYATTIEASRTTPKKVESGKFSFNVKANETYRIMAESNKSDGFYLQSGTDGVPLFKATIVFDETNAQERLAYLETELGKLTAQIKVTGTGIATLATDNKQIEWGDKV